MTASSSSTPICTICMEMVTNHEDKGVGQLKCGHKFHLACIGSYFNVKRAMQCPNCREIEAGEWRLGGGNHQSLHRHRPADLAELVATIEAELGADLLDFQQNDISSPETITARFNLVMPPRVDQLQELMSLPPSPPRDYYLTQNRGQVVGGQPADTSRNQTRVVRIGHPIGPNLMDNQSVAIGRIVANNNQARTIDMGHPIGTHQGVSIGNNPTFASLEFNRGTFIQPESLVLQPPNPPMRQVHNNQHARPTPHLLPLLNGNISRGHNASFDSTPQVMNNFDRLHQQLSNHYTTMFRSPNFNGPILRGESSRSSGPYEYINSVEGSDEENNNHIGGIPFIDLTRPGR